MTNDAMSSKKNIEKVIDIIRVDKIPDQAPSIIEDSNKDRWVVLSAYQHLGEFYANAIPISNAQTYKIIENKSI
jgi:hypothetical protein